MGYLLLNLYVHRKALYTAAHEETAWYVQKGNVAVCDCGKTLDHAERDRPMRRNCTCWNVGIGMLHLMSTLNSDLWSDVT